MTLTMRKVALLGAVVVATVGVAGAAAASSNLSHDASSHAVAAPKSAPDPHYNRNASGETYGSAARAIGPAQEPDLILVVSDQGPEGYVKKTDLEPPAFTRPEAALEWQAKVGTTRVLKVYKSDGRTIIGTFTVRPSDVRRVG